MFYSVLLKHMKTYVILKAEIFEKERAKCMSERYFYPMRLIPKEAKPGYVGNFIDLDIVVDGDSLEKTLDKAKEALGEAFSADKIPRNKATDPAIIDLPHGEGLVIVEFDRLDYEKKHNNKTINKVVTMPAWMAEIAKERKINCSKLLQRVLQHKFETED